MPRHRQTAWRKDPDILKRLVEVERLHLAGVANVHIAEQLKVDEKTIRNDLERIRTLWRERAGEEIDDLKARAVAELDDVRRRAIATAEFDQRMERAVLFNEPQGYVDCPGNVLHYLPQSVLEELEAGPEQEDTEKGYAFRCTKAHQVPLTVYHDFKGSAQFRGAKDRALNVARQASMDKAKVLGLITDKLDAKLDATEAYIQALREFGRGAGA